jgi:hypothetical protein
MGGISYQSRFSRSDPLNWYKEEEEKYGQNGKAFGCSSLEKVCVSLRNLLVGYGFLLVLRLRRAPTQRQ